MRLIAFITEPAWIKPIPRFAVLRRLDVRGIRGPNG
jgi:hypothetical protein